MRRPAGVSSTTSPKQMEMLARSRSPSGSTEVLVHSPLPLSSVLVSYPIPTFSGPGCSSIGGGAFTELGPFFPKGDGRGLRINNHSWNKGLEVWNFLLIFLEISWKNLFIFLSVKSFVCGISCRSRMVLLEQNLRLHYRRQLNWSSNPSS